MQGYVSEKWTVDHKYEVDIRLSEAEFQNLPAKAILSLKEFLSYFRDSG